MILKKSVLARIKETKEVLLDFERIAREDTHSDEREYAVSRVVALKKDLLGLELLLQTAVNEKKIIPPEGFRKVLKNVPAKKRFFGKMQKLGRGQNLVLVYLMEHGTSSRNDIGKHLWEKYGGHRGASYYYTAIYGLYSRDLVVLEAQEKILSPLMVSLTEAGLKKAEKLTDNNDA